MIEMEQRKAVIESLVEFVVRTSKNEGAPPEALAALPEVARLLLDEAHSRVT